MNWSKSTLTALIVAISLSVAHSAMQRAILHNDFAGYATQLDEAFKHGLSDPTGGEFHEVTILNNTLINRPEEMKGYGWVFPQKGSASAYVVCWNGLPYTNFKVGPKVDVEKMVEDFIKTTTDESWPVRAEVTDVAKPDSIMAIALLQRLGKMELLEKLAKRIKVTPSDYIYGFGAMVSDNRYSRAVLAWQRGDFELAKSDCEWLVHNSANFENSPSGSSRRNGYEELLFDSQRRMSLKARPPFDPDANRKLPIDRQVALVIEYLDAVQAHGYVDDDPMYNGDWIYEEALDIGEPMLDALVDCLEKDRRIAFIHNTNRFLGRYFIQDTVKGIASSLVRKIAGLNAFPRDSQGRTDFKALRTQIRLIKGLTTEERLFAVLKDDSTQPAQWVEVSQKLLMKDPASSVRSKDSGVYSEPKETFADHLRQRRSPSLAEMFEKRMLQAAGSKSPSQLSSREAGNALRIASCFVEYDPKSALLALKTLLNELVTATTRAGGPNSSDHGQLLPIIGKLTVLRIKAGDKGAQSDYETLLKHTGPNRLYSLFDTLQPLYGDLKWAEQVASRVMVGRDAPWSLSNIVRVGGGYKFAIVMAKLSALPSIRRSTIDALKDQTGMGIGTLTKEGKFHCEWEGLLGSEDDRDSKTPDPRDGQATPTSSLRVCDQVAWNISRYWKAPLFKYRWSLKDRNAAIQQIIAFIDKNHDKLNSLKREGQAIYFDAERY